MSTTKFIKGALALAAAAVFGAAFAQGTPPNPAAKDPATGAGQRSSQNTPMGTTGTPGGGGMTAGSTAAPAKSGSGTAMGAGTTTTDTSASSTTSTGKAKHKAKHKKAKKMKHDRG